MEKGYPVSMSDEEKAARAEERVEAREAAKVAEQAEADKLAKINEPDVAYSRAADESFGGEGFAYGNPAPGAGPDK